MCNCSNLVKNAFRLVLLIIILVCTMLSCTNVNYQETRMAPREEIKQYRYLQIKSLHQTPRDGTHIDAVCFERDGLSEICATEVIDIYNVSIPLEAQILGPPDASCATAEKFYALPLGSGEVTVGFSPEREPILLQTGDKINIYALPHIKSNIPGIADCEGYFPFEVYLVGLDNSYERLCSSETYVSCVVP